MKVRDINRIAEREFAVNERTLYFIMHTYIILNRDE